MMALTWSHLTMLFITQRDSPVVMDSHVCVCLCVAAAVKVGDQREAFCLQLASGWPLCSSARAGQAGE